MRRRLVSVSLVCLTALSLTACINKILKEVGPLGYIFLFFQGPVIADAKPAKAPKPVRVEGSVDVTMDAQIDGVPTGGYDITLTRTSDSVLLGRFTGTAKIKRQRFVKFTEKDSEELRTTIENILGSGEPGTVFDITKARAVVSAHQTPGGVNAVGKVKITFSGEVVEGEATGRIRGGKIVFEFDDSEE